MTTKTFVCSVMCLCVVLLLVGPGFAEDSTDARVREGFAKAWQAGQDTKTDRGELAVKLYREVWLKGAPYAHGHLAEPKLPPDASAESILRGEHGKLQNWQLWEIAKDICLGIFTERPEATLKAAAADFQGDSAVCQKAEQLLREWKRHLYRQGRYDVNGVVALPEPVRKKWEQIVRELYPAVSKQYTQLVPSRRKNQSEPLIYALRELDDPRAIPLLLGTAERDLTHYDSIRQLQRNRPALPALVKLLTDSDAQARWRACYALAGCPDAELTPHAVRLLGDKDPRVRQAALGLAALRLSPQRPELDAAVKALLDDPDREVRRACVLLLAVRKDIACAPALLELLRDGNTDSGRHSVLVRAMQDLTGESFGFGYHTGSESWEPTTPTNRAALEKFTAWVVRRKAALSPGPANKVLKGASP